jgi:hypothetical protein
LPAGNSQLQPFLNSGLLTQQQAFKSGTKGLKQKIEFIEAKYKSVLS